MGPRIMYDAPVKNVIKLEDGALAALATISVTLVNEVGAGWTT
jgi:hypothetical protein